MANGHALLSLEVWFNTAQSREADICSHGLKLCSGFMALSGTLDWTPNQSLTCQVYEVTKKKSYFHMLSYKHGEV